MADLMCIRFHNTDRVRVSQVSDPSECSDYIAQSALNYSNPTLFDLFTMPIATDLQQAFMLGITVPMVAYLTAWGYGVVINWFSKPDQY